MTVYATYQVSVPPFVLPDVPETLLSIHSVVCFPYSVESSSTHTHSQNKKNANRL